MGEYYWPNKISLTFKLHGLGYCYFTQPCSNPEVDFACRTRLTKVNQTQKIMKSSEQKRWILTDNKLMLQSTALFLRNKGFYYHQNVEVSVDYFNEGIQSLVTPKGKQTHNTSNSNFKSSNLRYIFMVV